jgi:hypothetical protein
LKIGFGFVAITHPRPTPVFNKTTKRQKCSLEPKRSKLVVAPGTGAHICEFFAENPHWRKRITELSSLYTDALNVAMERGGGTDD